MLLLFITSSYGTTVVKREISFTAILINNQHVRQGQHNHIFQPEANISEFQKRAELLEFLFVRCWLEGVVLSMSYILILY